MGESEGPLVANYLQRLLFATPAQARFILPLLLVIYERDGLDLPKVSRLIDWGIDTSARRGDAATVLWFLYAAIFLKVRLKAQTCTACIGVSCELVDLVLIHGKVLGLFNPAVADLRRRYKPVDFTSAAWLPLYEVQRNGWDNSPAFSKLGTAADSGRYYEHLGDKGVEFYASAPSLFTKEAFHDWDLGQAAADPDQQHARPLAVLPYD